MIEFREVMGRKLAPEIILSLSGEKPMSMGDLYKKLLLQEVSSSWGSFQQQTAYLIRRKFIQTSSVGRKKFLDLSKKGDAFVALYLVWAQHPGPSETQEKGGRQTNPQS
jgi:hypothetical protein